MIAGHAYIKITWKDANKQKHECYMMCGMAPKDAIRAWLDKAAELE